MKSVPLSIFSTQPPNKPLPGAWQNLDFLANLPVQVATQHGLEQPTCGEDPMDMQGAF